MYSPQRVSRPVAEQAYLGNEPDHVEKGREIHRRRRTTPGQLISSYSEVAGEEGEVQGDGPAEHLMSDHPRQPVQEKGSRAMTG